MAGSQKFVAFFPGLRHRERRAAHRGRIRSKVCCLVRFFCQSPHVSLLWWIAALDVVLRDTTSSRGIGNGGMQFFL